MPIYEYSCQKCGHHLEVMQKMSDKPLTRCPECKGKLEKIFSQTSFQLKGSGWYASDYTSPGKAEKSEKTDQGEKKTDQGEKKTDQGEKKTDQGEKKEASPSTTTCAATGGGCATGACEN